MAVEVDPKDISINVVYKDHGFFGGKAVGIQVTHVPTGVTVLEDRERSQHRNKALAYEKLLELLAADPAPGYAPKPLYWFPIDGHNLAFYGNILLLHKNGDFRVGHSNWVRNDMGNVIKQPWQDSVESGYTHYLPLLTPGEKGE